MVETDEFGAELTDFRKRVAELRAARALPTGDMLATLDTALLELQYVSDVLWPRLERLDATTRRADPAAGRREQQLLRALFQRLPLAVVLLDADGVVRRLNLAAGRLFGMRSGYATGRPLAASFRHDARAVLRSHIAAVARGEGDRSIVVELMRDPAGEGAAGPGTGTVRVTLTGVRPSGERHNAVLGVFQPAADLSRSPRGVRAATVPPARRPARRAGGPDSAEVTRHAQLMDLLDEMTTALLTAPGLDGPDGGSPLERACRVLHGGFADWVIADAVRDGANGAEGAARLRRALVLAPPEGPGSGHRPAVAAQDPAAAPLIEEAARTGSCVLRVRPEEPRALGEVADGAPLLGLVEASSLLSVPLLLPSGTLVGVLTLLRCGGRRVFELAEASAMERMSRHVALAARRGA